SATTWTTSICNIDPGRAGARRADGAGGAARLLPHSGAVGTRRRRTDPPPRLARAVDVFQVEARWRLVAPARRAGADLVRGRDLQGAPDPAPGRAGGGCVGAQAEPGADLRRPVRARPHAFGQRGGPLRGAALPGCGAGRVALRAEGTGSEGSGREPEGASSSDRLDSIPLREVVWRPCYRVIPSRYPPVDLFERI